MPDDASVPWSPDSSVDYYDNLTACMSRKGMPLPPRHPFSDAGRSLESVREMYAALKKDGHFANAATFLKAVFPETWEAAGFDAIFAGFGYLGAAAYLLELDDCVMRVGAMQPAIGSWNPPLPADPGPPHEMVPLIPPPELREPAAAPKPAIGQGTRTVAAAVGGLALAGVVYAVATRTPSPPVVPNAPIVTASPASAASGTYSLRWNCASSDWQCAQVHGGYSGVVLAGVSQTECLADLGHQGMVAVAPGGVGVWCQPGG